MNEINGINSHNFKISQTNTPQNYEIDEKEIDIFSESNANIDSNLIHILEKNGIEGKKDIGEKVIKNDGNFDTEEARIYAEGEAAIEEEIEKRVRQQMILKDLRGGKSRAEIEAEVRAEYEKEHPEYAAVKDEGRQVEKEFNEAKDKAMSDWMKTNPKPEPPNPITGGISDSARYERELKKWQEKYDAEVAKFEEQYAKENKNYATYKEQKEEVKNDGFKPQIGPHIWT